MELHQNLGKGFQHLIDRAGEQVRIKYYSQSAGSIYDDDVSLSLSGTTWTSGISMAISAIAGGNDAILKEQGLITDMDRKLFLSGNYPLTGSTMQVKIQIGSPTGENFSVIDFGKSFDNVMPQTQGHTIYKKAYLRRLTNGSLLGEA